MPRGEVATQPVEMAGDAEPFKTVDMKIDRPLTDGTATRQRNLCSPQPSEQWSEHQYRSPHGLDQIIGNLRVGNRAAIDKQCGTVPPLGSSKFAEQRQNGPGITEIRNVSEHMEAGSKQCRGYQRQCGIFRTADDDLSLERPPSFDNHLFHGTIVIQAARM